MMAMLTCSARGLRSTPDSMATPSCVKTQGKYLKCNPFFKIPIWNLEASSVVS
jgi:hypothetical protein